MKSNWRATARFSAERRWHVSLSSPPLFPLRRILQSWERIPAAGSARLPSGQRETLRSGVSNRSDLVQPLLNNLQGSYGNHVGVVFGASGERLETDDPRRRSVDCHLSRVRAGDENLPAEEGCSSWGSTFAAARARVRRGARQSGASMQSRVTSSNPASHVLGQERPASARTHRTMRPSAQLIRDAG